jgi:hypothetical protein
MFCVRILKGGYTHHVYDVDNTQKQQPVYKLTKDDFVPQDKLLGIAEQKVDIL